MKIEVLAQCPGLQKGRGDPSYICLLVLASLARWAHGKASGDLSSGYGSGSSSRHGLAGTSVRDPDGCTVPVFLAPFRFWFLLSYQPSSGVDNRMLLELSPLAIYIIQTQGSHECVNISIECLSLLD